jgi:hypothetical protein
MVTAGQGDVAVLERAGVQVVIRKAPYIHAKAIVADVPHRGRRRRGR